MEVDVRVVNLGAMGIGVRKSKNIVKRINLQYPIGWLRFDLERHFKNSATRRYGYTPRSGERGSGRRFKGSYQQTKLKRQGHTRPLEYSGTGRRLAVTRNRVTSTVGTAKAIINSPIFNRRNPNSRVNMVLELTTVLDSENELLDANAQKKLDAEMNRAAKQ